jgi:adenosylmethionine-8-amino-7-oxononanoate aminotransferase
MSINAAFAALRAKEHAFFWHPAAQMADYVEKDPCIMVRGEGYRVWDFNGKEYIDGNSGVWCVSLGYGQQRLIDAAQKQLLALPYSSLFAFVHEPAIELCARLVELMPDRRGKVFLVTDGSEAIDTAIKLVRQLLRQNGQSPTASHFVASRRLPRT